MSGGKFDYLQFRFDEIIEPINDAIVNNGKKRERKDSWDEENYYKYSNEIIAEFKNAIYLLKKAKIYTHRIDWLMSGDDGDESFLKRLKSELELL